MAKLLPRANACPHCHVEWLDHGGTAVTCKKLGRAREALSTIHKLAHINRASINTSDVAAIAEIALRGMKDTE